MAARGTVFVCFFAIVLAWAPRERGALADVIVAVGENAPAHYHVARALCRVLWRALGEQTCRAERREAGHAAAPVAILSDVHNGAIEFGLTQSNWVRHATDGTGPFEFMDVRFDNLRTLMALHGEPFTVVARRDSGITRLADLAGRRVNIGRPGSADRLVMARVMAAMGWSRRSFALADELGGREQSLALCHDRIQAMVSTRAHPDPGLATTLELCNARLIPVAGPRIDRLIAKHPYFARARIPATPYGVEGGPLPSFGVRLVIVTSADLPEQTAHAVVRAAIENLDRLRRAHPALGRLDARAMAKAAIAAPLHPGARRYYREQGL